MRRIVIACAASSASWRQPVAVRAARAKHHPDRTGERTMYDRIDQAAQQIPSGTAARSSRSIGGIPAARRARTVVGSWTRSR